MYEDSFRALIVDDEPIARRMLSFAFEQEGFFCDCANDGEQAIRLFSQNDYDVVISDVMMPNMNGHRLVKELQGMERTVMTIAHTSVLEPAVAKALIADGFDDVVFKPTDYAAFASKVRAILCRNASSYGTSSSKTVAIPPSQIESHLGTAELSVGNRTQPVCRVDGYQIRRKLGVGGMGEVYEAEQLPLRRPCAIKIMLADVSSDPVACARFEREARVVASLSSNHIVRIFDYGRTSTDQFYYAMELVEGKSLEEIVSENGPLEPARFLHFLTQVCEALQEAHTKGLVHRDLKASNIMVTGKKDHQDVVKVVDFGLVREQVNAEASNHAILTQAGILCGSPAYMSPEQVLDSDVIDHRADIYGLGVTAFFALTGELPFQNLSTVRTLFAHVYRNAEKPSSINPDISAEVDKIILKCLEKDPDRRFKSVQDLRDALMKCQDFGKWSAKSAADWWKQAGSKACSTRGDSGSKSVPDITTSIIRGI